jgi:hypothetical protein
LSSLDENEFFSNLLEAMAEIDPFVPGKCLVQMSPSRVLEPFGTA